MGLSVLWLQVIFRPMSSWEKIRIFKKNIVSVCSLWAEILRYMIFHSVKYGRWHFLGEDDLKKYFFLQKPVFNLPHQICSNLIKKWALCSQKLLVLSNVPGPLYSNLLKEYIGDIYMTTNQRDRYFFVWNSENPEIKNRHKVVKKIWPTHTFSFWIRLILLHKINCFKKSTYRMVAINRLGAY